MLRREIKMPFPRFKYHLSSPHSIDYGYITLGGMRIYRIDDVNEFYRALGFTNAKRKEGLVAEEFIWAEYHKDKCEKSGICLQVRIIKYLIRQLATFKTQYAAQIEGWLEKCSERKRAGAPECKECNPFIE